MHKLYCLGEMLIDFIPTSPSTYERHFGGAPANVALGVAKLGGNSQFLGQVGNDAFGAFLVDSLKKGRVNTETVTVSDTKNTPLAFVTLTNEGERSFSFYRTDTADLDYSKNNVESVTFDEKSIFHFCSVSLVPSNVKEAHDEAIKKVKEKSGMISFDPNLRFNLWSSHTLLKDTVRAYLPYADLLKVSEEELTFLTGFDDEEMAVKSLDEFKIKAILVSKGKDGSSLYIKDTVVHHKGFKVIAKDTTGSGDAFISAVLKQIQEKGIVIDAYTKSEWEDILDYANAAGALTATKKGATSAIPNHETIVSFIQKNT